MNVLNNYAGIDIEGVVEDLAFAWQSHPDCSANPNAFTKVKSIPGNVQFCCPFHADNNPSCGLMTDYPYHFNCFGCGASGTIDDLVMQAFNFLSTVEAARYLLTTYVDSSVRSIVDIGSILNPPIRESHMQHVLERAQGVQHPYLWGRGLCQQLLDDYGICYDRVTDSMVFPVHDLKGTLRFIMTRSVSFKQFYIERSAYKKDVLYGLWQLKNKRHRTVFINEAAIDCLSCVQLGYPAVAVLGKYLTVEQVMQLVYAGVNTVNLFFDNDTAGKEGARQAYNVIKKHSALRVCCTVFPDNSVKDANQLLINGILPYIKVVSAESYFKG